MNPDRWILAALAGLIVACLVGLGWAISQCEKPEECAAAAAGGFTVGVILGSRR